MKPMPFAKKLAHWCEKNHILDCGFYDTKTNIEYSWSCDFENPNWLQEGEKQLERPNRLFTQICGFYGEIVSTNPYTANEIIGMTTEGALNEAIHYRNNERLYRKFMTLLHKNGYELIELGNCYNIIMDKPSADKL